MGHRADLDDLAQKGRAQRQGQGPVRDCAAEWAFLPGPFGVDVDPLPVAGHFGERVDLPLVDQVPARSAQIVLAEHFVDAVEVRHSIIVAGAPAGRVDGSVIVILSQRMMPGWSDRSGISGDPRA